MIGRFPDLAASYNGVPRPSRVFTSAGLFVRHLRTSSMMPQLAGTQIPKAAGVQLYTASRKVGSAPAERSNSIVACDPRK